MQNELKGGMKKVQVRHELPQSKVVTERHRLMDFKYILGKVQEVKLDCV